MVTVLGIDVGSSSVKAAVLVGTQPVTATIRQPFPTRYDHERGQAVAEVYAPDIDRAIAKAARQAIELNPSKPPDVVALAAMSPSWVAIGRDGEALTPVVTHQDRRALAEAKEIETAFGKRQHLAVTGNRPVPGGISSTTAAWFARHQRGVMRRARLVGHLQTYLLHRWTGVRVMDPGNASYTGLWQTTANRIPTDGSSLWNADLCQITGISPRLLPSVIPGDALAGCLHRGAARALGVRVGTPVITGVIDTTAAVVLAGARPGMMINATGSTDVLAVVTEWPTPSDKYLTRALGVGDKFLTVATIAAAGSSIAWVRRTLYADLTDKAFFAHTRRLLAEAKSPVISVRFTDSLAGSRIALDQKPAAWHGLTLSADRDEMFLALLESLAQESAQRIDLLGKTVPRFRRDVLRTGGASALLSEVMYRYWKGKWAFADVEEAVLRGLGQLAQGRPV